MSDAAIITVVITVIAVALLWIGGALRWAVLRIAGWWYKDHMAQLRHDYKYRKITHQQWCDAMKQLNERMDRILTFWED